MIKEKQDLLVSKYPKLFVNEDFVCNCECGDGWFSLLDELCEKIKDMKKSSKFQILQVKEKFGGLRVYVLCSTTEINDLIDDAERKSFGICEHCGSKENVRQYNDGWIYTLCSNCYHEMKGDHTWII